MNLVVELNITLVDFVRVHLTAVHKQLWKRH